MSDMNGIEATRAITGSRPATRVIVLTVSATDDEVAAALHAGASAFLTKDTQIADVAIAVRAAASGSAWLSPSAAEAVLNLIRRQVMEPAGPATELRQLSARESEVLRLLGRGLENSEIAECLEISPSTAKNHVSSVLTKLGLPNRIQAAIYAVRNDLS
jgi:DNA-binding NarL/FixJ family response regulator